jgi:hypothetical protein
VHFEKTGTLPFGELSHGCQGIREYYQETFSTDDVRIALALLKVLSRRLKGKARKEFRPRPLSLGNERLSSKLLNCEN